MNISISDLLSLISVLVAIQAFVTAVFLWIIDKDKTKLAENVDSLKIHIEFTESLVESMIKVIDENYIKSKFYEGLIMRLYDFNGNFSKELNSDIRKNLSDLNFYIVKSKSELAMHGKLMRNKSSSFKNISEKYGDIDSYDIMNKVIKFHCISNSVNKLTSDELDLLKSFKIKLRDRIKNEIITRSIK